jgi:predicted GIY-YIG superfamily endonuclease
MRHLSTLDLAQLDYKNWCGAFGRFPLTDRDREHIKFLSDLGDEDTQRAITSLKKAVMPCHLDRGHFGDHRYYGDGEWWEWDDIEAIRLCRSCMGHLPKHEAGCPKAQERPPAPPVPQSSPQTWLYRLFDVQDRLLYVGITRDLHKRMAQHAGDKPWWHLVDRRTIRVYTRRELAADAETEAIRRERPLFNIAKAELADD